MEERKESCAPDNMFKNLLSLIEEADEQVKMPARKFYNNTFDQYLNDAIFNLLKLQQKT